MKMRHACSVIVVALAVVVGGCCGTARTTAEDPIEPAPALETAGWESHPAAPVVMETASAKPVGTASEVEALRGMNRRLMDQVSKLMVDVQNMKQPAPVVAAVAAPAIAPAAGTMQIGAVRSAVQKSGAGEMSVGLSPEGEVCLTVPGALCFASGRADLQAAAQEKLKKVFTALRSDFPELKVRVEGHTDADPIRKSKWESNEALSAARANAVGSYLVSSGLLASKQVESSGLGSARPVASNDTAAGKAENRRVEIYLIP